MEVSEEHRGKTDNGSIRRAQRENRQWKYQSTEGRQTMEVPEEERRDGAKDGVDSEQSFREK